MAIRLTVGPGGNFATLNALWEYYDMEDYDRINTDPAEPLILGWEEGTGKSYPGSMVIDIIGDFTETITYPSKMSGFKYSSGYINTGCYIVVNGNGYKATITNTPMFPAAVKNNYDNSSWTLIRNLKVEVTGSTDNAMYVGGNGSSTTRGLVVFDRCEIRNNGGSSSTLTGIALPSQQSGISLQVKATRFIGLKKCFYTPLYLHSFLAENCTAYNCTVYTGWIGTSDDNPYRAIFRNCSLHGDNFGLGWIESTAGGQECVLDHCAKSNSVAGYEAVTKIDCVSGFVPADEYLSTTYGDENYLKLKSTATLRNTGTSPSITAVDYDGLLIPGSDQEYSIGAHEYAGVDADLDAGGPSDLSGDSMDVTGKRIWLFHRLACRIVGHKVAVPGSHSGIYYVEGDVTSWLSGYTDFWIEGRTMEDKNIFQIDSATYDSVNQWTVITVTEYATYKANYYDDGSFITGRFSVDDARRLVSIGNVLSEMFEDGSLGNSAADKFEFELNDEDRAFYDKKNNSGYFYAKDVITELTSIKSESTFSPTSEVVTTWLRVKDLQGFNGSDFLFGEVEFVTGEGAGKKCVIVETNGYNIKVLGHLSKTFANTREYHTDIKVGDKIRVYKKDVFWVRFELWQRADIANKITVFFGKLDISTVAVDDMKRTVSVQAFSPVKDMFSKDWSSLDFECGSNLFRLSEIRALFLEASFNKLKLVQREEVDNILESISLLDVGFDVNVGWHIFDYYPGGLFRFDLGQWHQVVDEGSFEKSTQSVFIPSNADSTNYSDYAELPEHNEDTSDNAVIERKWHGGWCRFTVETEEALFMGAVNKTGLNDGNQRWKKLSGLPTVPERVLFYVNEERKITSVKCFAYRFDNGVGVQPHYVFDYCVVRDLVSPGEGSRDVTFPLNFGCKKYVNYVDSDVMANHPYPWRYEITAAEHVLQLYSFRKFNGVLLTFRNERYDTGSLTLSSQYESVATRALQHLSIHYSDGNGSFHKNIAIKYAGGYATAAGTVSSCRLDLRQSISRDGDIAGTFDSYQEDMVGMKIMALSGDNFLEYRKILTVVEVAGQNGKQVDITFDAFDNAVAANDLFIIINKNFKVKFIDYGDAFKSGEELDVMAIKVYRNNTTGAEYFLDLNKSFSTGPIYNAVTRPYDEFYMGHRRKFSCVGLSISQQVNYPSINNDSNDVAWYLKRSDIRVEYWNGEEWVAANNVVVLPTADMGMNDGSNYDVNANAVKLKISFEAVDWHTGGYDNADYSTTHSVYREAPSDIDEDKIYLMRVKLLNNTGALVSKAFLCDEEEINMMVCWEDINGWSKNTVEIEDGKKIVDTLTDADVTLDMFGIELQCRQSLTWLRQARPITRIESGSESFYAVYDYNNIDEKFSEDILMLSEEKNHITTIPRNINFRALMDKILVHTGYKNIINQRIHLDDFSNMDDNYLNIMGSDYDGVFPMEVGWDRAYVNNQMSEYFQKEYSDAAGYSHVSAIRDNGRYRAYSVHKDGLGIDLFTSDDMKNWSFVDDVVSNIGSYEILSVEVVKNRDDEDYAFYLTMKDSGVFKVYVVITNDPESIDLSAAVEILASASYNFGRCSVIHAKGVCDDTTGAYRYMSVVKYSNNLLGVDGKPSGEPYVHVYANDGDLDSDSDWNARIELVYMQGDNPVFLKSSFVANDQVDTTNAILNATLMVFKCPVDGKLYRTRFNVTGVVGSMDSSYFITYPNQIPELVETINLSGFSCVNDGYLYHEQDDDARPASVLAPTLRDVYLLLGVASDNWSAVAVNDMITDINADQFWLDKSIEMNEVDWFKSEYGSVIINDAVSTNGLNKRIVLGLRKPFSKILPRFSSVPYANRVLVRYWNGIQWTEFPHIYQNGRTITNSEVNPIFGFYFDREPDWVSDSFQNTIAGYTYPGLNQSTDGLYWVEISLPSGYPSDKEIELRGFRLCYTNVLAYKGRCLYMMDDWGYFKSIYSFNYEAHKNVKIDSCVYDKVSKNVIVNIVNDDPYEFNFMDSYLFDCFGRFKYSYPIWSINNAGKQQHNFFYNTPDKCCRGGYENVVTIGGSSYYVYQIGGWDEDFILAVFSGTALTGSPFIGYNTPISREQVIRKHALKNTDWSFNDQLINNVWMAKRNGIENVPTYASASRYQYSNSYGYLLFALNNSGLMNEELINGPFTKVKPGYYAFLEKNYQTRLEKLTLDIVDIVDDYPVGPSDDEVYLLSTASVIDGEANSLLHYKDSAWHFSRPYIGMIVKDLSDSNQLYFWNGYKWESIADNNIWPGRLAAAAVSMQLEFDLGQSGVFLPYYQGYDSKPSRFLDQNAISSFYGKKKVINYRDVSSGDANGDSFGGANTDIIGENVRATCAVELKDLSSCKDSVGNASITEDDGYGSDIVRVIEPAGLGVAFGLFGFRDVTLSGSVVRDDSTQVNPYSISAVALLKAGARVRNWNTVYTEVSSSYTEVTDEMNYKKLGENYPVNGGGTVKRIYLGSNSKFFSLSIAATETVIGNLVFEYLDVSGSWQTLTTKTHINDIFEGMALNDVWGRKTIAQNVYFDPFLMDWGKGSVNSNTKYWVRISTAESSDQDVKWINLAGTILWDNLMWWDDYTITSDKAPSISGITDAEKRWFDTYVPVSIEYDIVNKKLIGCFWNFDPTVNEYYPFKISFDRDELYNSAGEFYWSWETGNTLKIIDSSDYEYIYKIQSLVASSQMDSKALLVDDYNSDRVSKIANLKSLKSGDKLFNFDI